MSRTITFCIVMFIVIMATVFFVGTIIAVFQALRHFYYFNYDKKGIFDILVDRHTWYGMWNRWALATLGVCGIWIYYNYLIF